MSKLPLAKYSVIKYTASSGSYTKPINDTKLGWFNFLFHMLYSILSLFKIFYRREKREEKKEYLSWNDFLLKYSTKWLDISRVFLSIIVILIVVRSWGN